MCLQLYNILHLKFFIGILCFQSVSSKFFLVESYDDDDDESYGKNSSKDYFGEIDFKKDFSRDINLGDDMALNIKGDFSNSHLENSGDASLGGNVFNSTISGDAKLGGNVFNSTIINK